jgi:hypothetical protein
MASLLSSGDECNARSLEGQHARSSQKPDREGGHDTKPLALVIGVSLVKSKKGGPVSALLSGYGTGRFS